MQCTSCGQDVTLVADADTPDRWLRKLGNIGVICDECDAKREQAVKRLEAGRDREHREQDCGLPSALRGLSWSDFDTSEGRAAAMGAAQAWAQGTTRGLLMCGPVGTGKTRLAATATWTALDRRMVRWMSVAALIARVSSFDDKQVKRQANSILMGNAALVLDDLDKVSPSEWVKSQLFLAVDHRIENNIPLLVTTNLRPDAIADKLGDALASRLAGYCTVINLGGRDRRMDVDAEEAAA